MRPTTVSFASHESHIKGSWLKKKKTARVKNKDTPKKYIPMEKKVDKGEHYLPSQRKPKMLSQKTSRNPTEQTEESSQRTSLPIQTHIVHNICHGEQKPEIWYEAKATLERAIK